MENFPWKSMESHGGFPRGVVIIRGENDLRDFFKCESYYHQRRNDSELFAFPYSCVALEIVCGRGCLPWSFLPRNSR